MAILAKLKASIARATARLPSAKANATTTLIVASYQLLSVPVLLNFWGADLYAIWLIINALSSYSQVADIGINTSTCNELTLCHEHRDYSRCSKLLVNNIAFVAASFALLLIGVTIVPVAALEPLLSGDAVSVETAKLLLIGMILQIYVGMQANLLTGVLRATGRNVKSLHIDNCVRTCEYIVTLGAAAVGGGLLSAVVLVVLVKIIGLVVKARCAETGLVWRVTVSELDIRVMRTMLRPSLAFALIPIGGIILNQTPVIVAGRYFGSAEVVIFSTSRTLVNFGRSITDILYRSLWPEVTYMFAKNQFGSLLHLYKTTRQKAMMLTAIWICAVLIFGESVHQKWTGLTGHWSLGVVAMLCIVQAISVYTASATTVLQATNRHGKLALLTIVSALISSLVLWTATESFGSLYALIVGLLLHEFVLLWYSLPAVRELIDNRERSGALFA